MDKDEGDFIKSDYRTYQDDREFDSCTYCGEENEDLNVVHYEISPDYEINVLGVNPKPHEKLKVQDGWVKRIELVCDECLKEEYDI